MDALGKFNACIISYIIDGAFRTMHEERARIICT